MEPRLVTDPDDASPDWFTAVLRHAGEFVEGARVVEVAGQRIGTGQIGTNVRFRLAYEPPGAGPASLVGKFASSDPTSRQAGIQTRTYETEVAFYRDLAATVDVRRPRCYYAQIVPGTAEVALVLEDLAPAVQGDQVAGCTPAQAELAVIEAARLHGPRWGDPGLGEVPWLAGRGAGGATGAASFAASLWGGFVDRYGERLWPEAHRVGALLAEGDLAPGTAPEAPRTVTHGDFRLDNLLFGTDEGGPPVAVVDWQTVGWGVGTADVSYLVGSALDPQQRRAHERRLIERYHATLRDYGVERYGFDDCWEDYRRFSPGGFFMAVVASMLVGRTDRGDDMFLAMANRHAVQICDLGLA